MVGWFIIYFVTKCYNLDNERHCQIIILQTILAIQLSILQVQNPLHLAYYNLQQARSNEIQFNRNHLGSKVIWTTIVLSQMIPDINFWIWTNSQNTVRLKIRWSIRRKRLIVPHIVFSYQSHYFQCYWHISRHFQFFTELLHNIERNQNNPHIVPHTSTYLQFFIHPTSPLWNWLKWLLLPYHEMLPIPICRMLSPSPVHIHQIILIVPINVPWQNRLAAKFRIPAFGC